MKLYNYVVELYLGETYVGNGLCKTIEGCFAFIEKDGNCDKAIIFDNKGKAKYTVKINHDV